MDDMKRFVKRFAALVIIALALSLNVGDARAAVGGNYSDALKLVREGKFNLALKEFMLLAETGHAASQFSVGLIYHLGRGTQVDLEKAYYWYKRSVLNDHVGGLNNIGMMYLNGEYVVQNRDVAFRLFKKASATHSQAMDNLGQCFENGWGTKRDIRRAINMYSLAGDNSYMRGWYHLGQLYEKGYPKVPRDIEKAVEWYTKAAERKEPQSIKRLKRLNRLPAHLEN